jgi:hypothetical protein
MPHAHKPLVFGVSFGIRTVVHVEYISLLCIKNLQLLNDENADVSQRAPAI